MVHWIFRRSKVTSVRFRGVFKNRRCVRQDYTPDELGRLDHPERPSHRPFPRQTSKTFRGYLISSSPVILKPRFGTVGKTY